VKRHRDVTNPEREDEAELLAGLRAGDGRAYEALVRRHGGRMLAVARRLLRNEDEAEDAVQEAFLAAWRALPAFEGQSRLGTWLHRIVVNAALMRLRSRRRRPEASIDELLPRFDEDGHRLDAGPPPASADALLEHAELRAAVRRCIDLLPDSHRTVILLRDIEELDTKTVAALLEISEAAAKVRLHRARQALRTLLERERALRADEEAPPTIATPATGETTAPGAGRSAAKWALAASLVAALA
jgi:RNA polymerase sigma-70 factor (ECF subfamily)